MFFFSLTFLFSFFFFFMMFSFDFTALLHTYFKLEDISTLKITGLEGKEFIDSLKNDVTKTKLF